MKRLSSGFWYGALFLIIFILDRVTKHGAVNYLINKVTVTNFLSFDLWFNRGISWGMFHSDNPAIFIGVSSAIAILIIGLIFYAYVRWMNHCNVIGEVLVFAGGFSNIIDRLVYGGVVDFILVALGPWSLPVFNIADVAIVLGVGIMLTMNYYEK